MHATNGVMVGRVGRLGCTSGDIADTCFNVGLWGTSSLVLSVCSTFGKLRCRDFVASVFAATATAVVLFAAGSTLSLFR